MLSDIKHYEPSNPDLWHGRKDSLAGERFFQQVDARDIRDYQFVSSTHQRALVGFCSDEGIRRNEGRTGAKSGPLALREQLAKLSCLSGERYLDLGNIVCELDLESAQEQLARMISHCHEHDHRTFAFGGGHEIAWGHFLGLKDHYPELGIINFDAHFDLRPVPKPGYGTSGTPFWQIARYCQQQNRSFDYCCLGTQPHANTQSLFTCADTFKVSYLTTEQINERSLDQQIAFLDAFLLHKQHIWLSICMDVFAESHAPGVSAPQALGLTPWQALPLLKYLMQTGKVVSVDIAELSPPLDHNSKTARLAATLAAELLDIN